MYLMPHFEWKNLWYKIEKMLVVVTMVNQQVTNQAFSNKTFKINHENVEIFVQITQEFHSGP